MMITNITIIKYMRTIVDIPDNHVKVLDQLSKKKKLSRANIIRQAIAGYIANYNKSQKSYESAFGVWKNKPIDGLAYQQKLRDEWNK